MASDDDTTLTQSPPVTTDEVAGHTSVVNAAETSVAAETTVANAAETSIATPVVNTIAVPAEESTPKMRAKISRPVRLTTPSPSSILEQTEALVPAMVETCKQHR